MIDHGSAAVRASGEGRDGGEVVRTTLIPSLLGKFVFRMCHCYSVFKLLFAQIFHRLGIALPVGMDLPERKRNAYFVVNILAQVQDPGVSVVVPLIGGMDREGQVLEAPVAGDDHAAVNPAGERDGIILIIDLGLDLEVRVQNPGFSELAEERTVRMPMEYVLAVLQAFYRYLKGLQR